MIGETKNVELYTYVGMAVFSYLLGSLPFGLWLVKLTTGKDIRLIESGRTGGTNVGRAAGTWAGVVTAFLDGLKATTAVWVARAVMPGNPWLHVLAPVVVILGHNYSIFLIERNGGGRLHLRGGAGGASCAGGSIGLWFPSLFIIVPIAISILYFAGYASLATLSMALISTLLFCVRAYLGISPWQYAVYGLLAEALLIWALRPNIKRLLSGKERLIGRRAQKKMQQTAQVKPGSSIEISSSS